MRFRLSHLTRAASAAALMGACASDPASIHTSALQTSITRNYASASCPQLAEGLKAQIATAKADEDKERQEHAAAPTTLWRGLQRYVSPQEAREPSAESFDKDRQAALLLNEKLAEKGCPTIDVDGELRQARWSNGVEVVKP